MTKEELFFKWWEEIKDHKEMYNLRMAWDAGYEAAESEGE